jgi:N-acetylmuramoyl-L-alanine amidase
VAILLRNTRKTERGAKRFLIDRVVRAVPFALLTLAIAGLLAGQVGEPHHVTAVRFWSLGEVTRIAVETDGDFRVHSDRLEDPDRIFYDLSGTKPSLGPQTLTVIPVLDRFVRQIRVAESQRNTTRVVLDLAGTAEPTLSRLENPSRLIIELRAPGGEPRVPNGSESRSTSEKNSAAPTQTLPRKIVARRQFVPPPASIVSAISPRLLLEPPPILVAQSVGRSSSATAINFKVAAGVPYAGPPAILAKPPAAIATPAVAVLNTPVAVLNTPVAVLNTPVAVLNTPVAPLTSAPAASPAPAEVGLPAKRNASGDRSMIRVLGLKVGRIVLDPGHGGHDTGTTGPDGLREKDLVLDVAKRLGAMIEERMGSEVIFTRSDDSFVALERRTEIANEAKADLFLSIHANSSTLRTAAGVETYYLSFTTSRSALEVAARENSASQKTVYELQDLLEKIALKDKVEESREFATRVQSALYTISAKTNVRAKDRGVRKAPFVVLIGASMPSVLAEIGFISNPRDETTMKRSEYRDRLAEALYKGLASYASTLSHFQVAQRR